MGTVQKQVIRAFAEAFIQLGESLMKIYFEEEKPVKKPVKAMNLEKVDVPKDLPASMKVRDVAKYLGIDRRQAYTIIKEMGIPVIKLSERRTRVPRDAFLNWVKSQANSTE